MSDEAPRARGLPAVEQARDTRAKLRFPPVKFWGYTGLILTVCFILHWKWTQSELEGQRQKLLASQRAVAVELGPRWISLRDRIERWTAGLAAESGPEVVDGEALKGWDFRDKPGIYVRLPLSQGASAELIRRGAKDSLKDAFTACLVRVPNANALAGGECKHNHDCPSGESCNELEHCARPSQPYNLRVAYRTMYVLSDAWVREAQESNDVGVRLLAMSFDDMMRDDLPLAADLLTRAQYFLAVLDEPSAGEAPPSGPGAADELLATGHPARVAVWRLADDKLVLRVRRDAGGELLGAKPDAEPKVLAARQRQANSCALALAVRKAMGDPGVP